jgi:hypothetical protein
MNIFVAPINITVKHPFSMLGKTYESCRRNKNPVLDSSKCKFTPGPGEDRYCLKKFQPFLTKARLNKRIILKIKHSFQKPNS